MYIRIMAIDVVRVPPERLGEDLASTVKELLRDKLEGRMDKKIGMFIAILDVVEMKEGRIMIGDGGVWIEAG